MQHGIRSMSEPERVVELIATTAHHIVGITTFQGQLIVATERGVYRYEHREFVPIKFTDEEQINAQPVSTPIE